ncbi:C69 family dipeptidase [Sediminitomix flava]|uniref:Dipeptidase n=1 Tax=Sediminitomix flava TaxID=379075 RepID=A0A316A2Y5_SEDFL|nr:C69 family dipeptidase [Sediminitomix flava]PWJ44067.1 dipeptidase [Sediminitomix flava]
MGNIFVALGKEVSEGHVMIGKNANRPINEGQALIRIPRVDHFDKEVECSFISIPQVSSTYEIIISKPYKLWGAEMGMNEFDLAVACSVVEGKNKFLQKNDGLTAQDISRLILERCSNPQEAIALVIELLEKYGQDVNQGSEAFPVYGNATFVISNAEEAWIIETVGHEWIYKRINQFQVISDTYVIGKDYEKHSENLISLAKKLNVQIDDNFSFKESFNRKLNFLEKDNAKIKEELLSNKLSEALTPRTGIELLKCHFKESNFHPARSSNKDFCLHASGTKNAWQTASSMLVVLRKNSRSTCWMTGTSSPCVSIFKPFFIPGKNIYQGLYAEPSRFLDDSLWWKAENFIREANLRYHKTQKTFGPLIRKIQDDFLLKEHKLFEKESIDVEKMDALSDESLRIHSKRVMEWAYVLKKEGRPISFRSPLYNSFLEKKTIEVTPLA